VGSSYNYNFYWTFEGVEVERVWKSHLALHWTSKIDFPATVFNSDDVRGSGTESRRVYLERLFQKVISNLDPGTG